MAFDWTKVDGYSEDMTAEQKIELLNKMQDEPVNNAKPEEVPAPVVKPVSGATISKAQFDKVSSELAAVKKQLRSRMTEEEQKEAERATANEQMMLELETLRKERALANLKSNYLKIGYDPEIADEISNASIEGDVDNMFRLHAKQYALMEKNLRAKILKETPVPPASDTVSDELKAKKEMAELRKYFGLSN